MSDLIGSMAALSALRAAGEAVVRTLKPDGKASSFAEVLSKEDAKLEAVKSTDESGAGVNDFSARLLNWLSSLGLPANGSLRFSLDSSGSPVLDHPPGHAVASDFRLRENQVLRQQLVDQIRSQPSGTLTIPMN